jgi:hypothetical protein
LIAAAQRVHRGEMRIADLPLHQIRQAMTTLNDYRNDLMVAKNWGITDFYNALLPRIRQPARQAPPGGRCPGAQGLRLEGQRKHPQQPT